LHKFIERVSCFLLQVFSCDQNYVMFNCSAVYSAIIVYCHAARLDVQVSYKTQVSVASFFSLSK